MFVVWDGDSDGKSTLMLSDAVTRENTTYSCPCANTGMHRLMATQATDCPWEWLMVMANASCTGNCWHFRWIVKSAPQTEGDSVILGMKATSPSWSLPKRQTCSTLFDICTTVALVPLHRPSLWSRFWSRIIGLPGLSLSFASGKPEAFRELRNSTGTMLGKCCMPTSITWVSALM